MQLKCLLAGGREREGSETGRRSEGEGKRQGENAPQPRVLNKVPKFGGGRYSLMRGYGLVLSDVGSVVEFDRPQSYRGPGRGVSRG